MRRIFGINLTPTPNRSKTPPPIPPNKPTRGSTTICPADPGGYPPGRNSNKHRVSIEEIMKLCWLIHKYGKTEGIPKVVDGYCEGYQVDETNDEPCESCKECKFNQSYED